MFVMTLEAPWYTFQKMLAALFEKDDEVIIGEIVEVPNDETLDYVIDIEVRNHKKYLALDRVMPAVKRFGGVTLGLKLYDEENTITDSALDIYRTIFDKNPIVKDIVSKADPEGIEHGYVEFIPEVVQFFDDDISDSNGNWNGLAEDIARQVFDSDLTYNNVHFCTALKE